MEKPVRVPHQVTIFLLILAAAALLCMMLFSWQAPSDEETMVAWLKDNQAILPDVLAYLQDEQTSMTRETFQQFDQLYRSGTLSEITSVLPKGRLIVRFVGGQSESGERYLHYAPDCEDLTSLSPLTAEQMADFAVVQQSDSFCELTDGTATVTVERVAEGWFVIDYRK